MTRCLPLTGFVLVEVFLVGLALFWGTGLNFFLLGIGILACLVLYLSVTA